MGVRRRAGRRLAWAGAGLVAAALLTACTSGGTTGSSGTVTVPTSLSSTPNATTTVTPTPVTPAGMATGPGVTDTTIALGLLDQSTLDRGFRAGVDLWQQSINRTGGICGRSVEVASGASGESAPQAYQRLGLSVLGFLALTDDAEQSALTALSAPDGVTVLMPSGSSSQLTANGPIPLGATDDIKAINALSYLVSSGVVAADGTVGVLSDGSAAAANALTGARWWAATTGMKLDVRTGSAASLTGWGEAKAVLALTGPTQVDQLLSAAPAVTVVTTLDGYDPATVPAGAAPRLLVSQSTPAYGSDHPAAAAVATAYAATGGAQPGPRLLAGYAVAAGWGRVLVRACADQALTRTGVAAALTTVGPASVDSLFGPSDPAVVVQSQLPATRLSSMAQADPAAATGLTPLIWMEAANGIAGYDPAH